MKPATCQARYMADPKAGTFTIAASESASPSCSSTISPAADAGMSLLIFKCCCSYMK